jgi:hypothetical protein
LEFNAFPHANCEPGPDDGQLAFFNPLRSLSKPVQLHVGKRIYIRHTYGIAGVGSNYVSCMSMASFVPEAGKTYKLVPLHAIEESNTIPPSYYSVSCDMKIIDAQTKALVADNTALAFTAHSNAQELAEAYALDAAPELGVRRHRIIEHKQR